MTKKDIIAWFKHALGRISERVKLPISKGGISGDDYNVYRTSIEAHFSQLKKAFNYRLKSAKVEKLTNR